MPQLQGENVIQKESILTFFQTVRAHKVQESKWIPPE